MEQTCNVLLELVDFLRNLLFCLIRDCSDTRPDTLLSLGTEMNTCLCLYCYYTHAGT